MISETTERIVYMDNNATTKVAPEVVTEMMPYFSEYYGNPSSMHTFGGQVGSKVAEAREKIASLIGASPDELIFTSCGTESDSTAILSALQALPEKRHIVTTRFEHPAVKHLCENLDKLTGHKHKVTQLMVESDGTIDLQKYEESLTDERAIVSIMWANNETGVIFPIEKMVAIAKERGILFHTDAVQAVGKIPINLATLAPKALEMTGAIADGWLGTSFTPDAPEPHLEYLRRGAEGAGRSLDDLTPGVDAAVASTADPDPLTQAHNAPLAGCG